MFTVQVFYKNTGKPAKSQRVSCSLGGFFGGVTKEQYTNENGEAHFDYDPKSGEVYVNGKTAFKGNISGRVVIYV